MIATHAAATAAASILDDDEARVPEKTAAQAIVDSYNTKLPVLDPKGVEYHIRCYINRRQAQDRYGK